MKNINILIILCTVITGQYVYCNEIIVDDFDTLINTQYQAGDVLTFTRGFSSESDIGNIFPNINNITIEGNNFIINGDDEYSGFIVNSQADFNQLDLSHCKGQTVNNSSYAGGILNNGGNVHVTYAALSENFADAAGLNFSYGGALYNTNGGYTDINTVLFDGNHTSGGLSTGGAVSNGAYNNNDANMDIYNSIFQNNTTHASVNSEGGAIFNSGEANISTTTFRSNSAIGDAQAIVAGGAIYNSGDMKIDNVRFFDNAAGNGNPVFGTGGAIYNTGTLDINNSTFEGNKVNSIGVSEGGAIYNNTGATLTVKNSVFQNNSTNDSIAGEGGAIYNTGNLIVENSTFQNNYQEDSNKNDIYNSSTGSIEFSGEGTTNILSGLDGSGNVTKTGDGILNIGGTNNNYNGNFTFTGGTVNLLADSSYFNAAATYFGNNINFNIQNKEINNINFGDLTLSGRTNLSVDMNLNTNIMDTISANSLSGAGELFVSSIGIEGIPKSTYISIPFANSVLKDDVSYTPGVLNTPIYEYNVRYNNSNGNFELTRGGFNSGIFSSQVATQLAGYLTQIDTYKNIFSNLDMVMISPPGEAKIGYINKTASTNPNFTYSPFQIPEQRAGIWFKPYTTFESVRLKNGPKVSNVSYGSLLGIESGLTELKNGWYGLYGLYASYNGSHQAFNGNDIYNNGGLLGIDAVFYKGNFFSAWTIDAGANASEATTTLGRENFAMIMAGIAQKTGYNIETFERRLIIQPSILTSYTFVNTFNHKGVQNVNINTRPLNALQVEPGIKLIANCKKYLQPYIQVSMVWNLIDSAKFRADDVFLPNLTVKPFVQYGIGVQKRYGERITGFLEAMIRNGGRQGVALQFGLRISI